MANHLHTVWLFTLLGWASTTAAEAAVFQEGRLSTSLGDVTIRESAAAPVHLKPGASINAGSVQTGANSRAEITFHDQSVLRLGDKTDVAIEPKSRLFDLSAGAILTQVPSGVGRTTVKVHRIIATATGTTLLIECLPKAYIKFISLDGTSRLCLKQQGWATDCVLLRAGQMLIANPEPKSLPEVVDVDLNRLLETSQFITEFPTLPAQEGLSRAAAAQQRVKKHGSFADTNLVILGRGTLVQRSPEPVASPSPSTTTIQSMTPAPSSTRPPAVPK
jgi:FecR protein